MSSVIRGAPLRRCSIVNEKISGFIWAQFASSSFSTVRNSGENITLRTPGIDRIFRANGEGIEVDVLRNSIVGLPGGRRECSVGINLRACSFGVGVVWMKTVRRDGRDTSWDGEERRGVAGVKSVRWQWIQGVEGGRRNVPRSNCVVRVSCLIAAVPVRAFILAKVVQVEVGWRSKVRVLLILIP